MSSQSHPPRTVLVLDVSGSMFGMKSQTLHLSAIRFIEDIPDNNYVGIVLFDQKVWIEHNVVQITNKSIRDSLTSKVPQMARGGTDIGGGLLMGLKALKQQNLSTKGATLVLVTDGEDICGGGRGKYVDKVLPDLLKSKVKVICIAIGNSADEYLERLAKETNGKVYNASDNNREMAVRVIESAFQEVKISKELSETITIEVSKDLIAINEQTVNKTIIIDSDIGRNTNFTIGSEDFDKFSVSLTSPKGQKYDSTSSEYVKNQSLKRHQFKLKSEEPGIWTISFVKHSNVNICASISVTSQPLNSNAAQMRVWLKDADINTGMPPIIFAEIRKGSDAVIGAEVTATIDKPNGTQTNVKLNNLNDIYCNYFTDYCGSGRYNVSVYCNNEIKKSHARSFQNKILAEDSEKLFQRQKIAGCFKIDGFMPNDPKDKNKLEFESKKESLKLKSEFLAPGKSMFQNVEAPAPRNILIPTIEYKKSNNEKKVNQSDDSIKEKEEIINSFLVLRRLIGFSKIPEDLKKSFDNDMEKIKSVLFDQKQVSSNVLDNTRLKLEEIKRKFS